MDDDEMREQIEMWAASRHTARNMKKFMTTAAKSNKKGKRAIALGDPNADLPRGPSGGANSNQWSRGAPLQRNNTTPTPAPSPRPAPSPTPSPARPALPKSSTAPSAPGGWGGGGGAAVRRPPTQNQQQAMTTPPTAGAFNPNQFRLELRDDVKKQTSETFGKLYEMFLANEISNSKRWQRYRYFTSSIYVRNLSSYVDWVKLNGTTTQIDTTKIEDYRNRTVLYLQSYNNRYRQMLQTYESTRGQGWNKSEKNLPSLRVSTRLVRDQARIANNELRDSDVWPFFLSSKIYEPLNSEVLNRDFGMLSLNTELEIDLAGHTWMDGDTHHLHFGEIKSSTKVRGNRKGIAQLIRLGYGAMWTMHYMGLGKKIHVEATLFANDDSENDYNYVSEFSITGLAATASSIVAQLKNKPPNATFKITFQLTRGNTIDDRYDYGIITTI